jgi:hypothetical protein
VTETQVVRPAALGGCEAEAFSMGLALLAACKEGARFLHAFRPDFSAKFAQKVARQGSV